MSLLNTLFLTPLEYLFDMVTYRTYQVFNETVITLVVLSAFVNVITLPLYREAERMEAEEKKRQESMSVWLKHIRSSFQGDERMMMTNRLYRVHHYHPLMALKGSLSLFLQIPFFLAAYRYISELRILQKVEFCGIADLAREDGLIRLFGMRFNLLPFIMTAINLASALSYVDKKDKKKLVQMAAIALVFLLLLYRSPSGLVLYWIFNNIFSLGKNVYRRWIQNKRLFIFGCLSVLPLLYVYHEALGMGSPDWYSAHNHYLLLILLPLLCYLLYLLGQRFPLLPEKLAGLLKGKASYGETFIVLLALTLLAGCVIPLGVISAAPEDFVDLFHYEDPFRYCAHSSLVYAGIFIGWGSLIWLLAGKYKKGVKLLSSALLGCFLADFFLNGRGFGSLNISLEFDLEPQIGGGRIFGNLLLLTLIVVVVSVLGKCKPAWLSFFGQAALIAMLLFSGKSYVSASSALSEAKTRAESMEVADTESGEESETFFTLDRNGRNVMIIMLDRAISSYIPFMLAEKPELKEMLDGFVYYPDTLSFGCKTVFAAASIYGGYEYTPENMNKREEELLGDKQNEALRLLPVLFGEEGWKVSVTDPPYAGYSLTPDLTIFDEDPNVKASYLMGYFGGGDTDAQTGTLLRGRSFVFYSLLRLAPLCFFDQLYDGGNYQSVFGKEHDLQTSFMQSYLVLKHMSDITEVESSGENHVMIMTNNTTHELSDLQLPDYEPAARVDNSAYDTSRKTDENGRTLYLRTVKQDQHYKIDMAALLTLGKYFDYLREEGVYDNTRIILVSDHGHDLAQFDEFVMLDGKLDVTMFNPLLLVKDFDSHGFAVSDSFMTNADVPSIAMEGLIKDPVNPFTGNAIGTQEKEGELHVTASWDHEGINLPVDRHCFDTSDGPWFAVHDGIFDEANWSVWKEQGESGR
ncbi:MAG: YidC/Oxa1 family membrane protein insertase [Lachnospiraceae bacterium]|nr:YidC/Oxa1 family membrane protein insertase [Lachnospiraceae bacterium]